MLIHRPARSTLALLATAVVLPLSAAEAATPTTQSTTSTTPATQTTTTTVQPTSETTTTQSTATATATSESSSSSSTIDPADDHVVDDDNDPDNIRQAAHPGGTGRRTFTVAGATS